MTIFLSNNIRKTKNEKREKKRKISPRVKRRVQENTNEEAFHLHQRQARQQTTAQQTLFWSFI